MHAMDGVGRARPRSDRLRPASTSGTGASPAVRTRLGPRFALDRARAALSLLEVLLAGLVLSLAIIPSIGLMSSSSQEIAKVRSRIIAVNLAASMVEEMRARPLPARADYGPLPADQLPHLAPIVQAYRSSNPPAASRQKIDALLASFERCFATRGTAVPISAPPASLPNVVARVEFTVAGKPYALTSEGWLGSAP